MGFAVNHDEQEAVDRGIDGLRFFQFALGHYYRQGVHRPGRTDLWQQYLAVRDRLIADAQPGAITGGLSASRGAIGTPDQVRDYLRRLADIGVDQAVFIQQGGKNQHDDICDSLRLFAGEVMPEFHAEEEERQRRKAAELAPYIEAAMQRKRVTPPLTDDQIEAYPAYGHTIAETKAGGA
jgi:hypothetical protein